MTVWDTIPRPGALKDKIEYAKYFEDFIVKGSTQAEEFATIAQNQCNFYKYDNPVDLGPRSKLDEICYLRHSLRSVLMLGDSTSADLYHGLKETLPKDISLLLIFSSGCTVMTFDEATAKNMHCTRANQFAMERIKADPPTIILISAHNSYDIDYIRQFSTLVKSYGVKHVLVLSQRPEWKPALYKIIIKQYWNNTPRYISTERHQDDELLEYGKKFEANLRPNEPFEYVNERAPFCEADKCLAYLGDDRKTGLISFDTTHLRPFASVWLAKKQLTPLILERLKK